MIFLETIPKVKWTKKRKKDKKVMVAKKWLYLTCNAPTQMLIKTLERMV